MTDDAPSSEISALSTQDEDQHEELPDRLRVHSLARVLGTTSKQVLDALTELDGQARSAHSSVDRVDAVRVRDLLGSAEPAPAGPAAERAEYMPLFVAPQPVNRPERDTGSGASDDGGFEQDGDDDENDDRPAARRRRRGRRGRGRGRGSDERTDAGDDADDTEDADEAENAEDANDADDTGTADEAGNRRRRRRRRRKSGPDADDAASSDDPPNTVVHERAPRSAKSGKSTADDEIQGINGSTRLEAKRQRRRDGRDAGRRRPPILSEAEFLARREAVERVMVVRDQVRAEPPHQGARYTQIAVLEDSVVVEHFVTSAASTSLVGNVYLGIVQNVLPSMEAAFVDIGRGSNGVLYAGEVNWEAAGLGGANRRIEQALKPGDYVVVQVSKDPVGHKGARLTTQVSLPGRYLVYVPGASSTGISRKLPDTERQRLKEILREVVPSDAGVIIRTASEGVKEEDIRADVARLQQRWTEIEATAAETEQKAAGSAVTLYEEPDVLFKVIRDLFNDDFTQLIVSGDDAWKTINEYVNSVAPELTPKLTQYQPLTGPDEKAGPEVFAVHRIDEQLAKAMDRKVWLPSGGTLVIDRTEAMTVVDVNTGKFTGSGGNLEETVTKNNLEAAEETVRQLRLRDIGGIIVIDFIDMVLESNRDLVLRRLTEAMARDRTRHQVSEVTSLGLVQLTRKRLGTGLVEAFSTPCPQCAGRGIVVHADPVESGPPGRKSDSAPRRGKRSKKAKSDEPAVAKIPPHAPGEHPMFKAMAAANDRQDDESEETAAESAQEQIEEQITRDDTDEDDYGDTDEEEEDDDEVEVDFDDEDDSAEDFDDDLDVIDRSDEDFEPDGGSEVTVRPARPRRRRAAARPAGPPIHED